MDFLVSNPDQLEYFGTQRFNVVKLLQNAAMLRHLTISKEFLKLTEGVQTIPKGNV